MLTKLACPCCGAPIHIESQMLIKGTTFPCSNASCGASVALNTSSANLVEQAFSQAEKIKALNSQ